MEKDKKYNVVLGLMIFFFILVVGISLAWGLSSIGKNSTENGADKQNSETVSKDESADKAAAEKAAADKAAAEKAAADKAAAEKAAAEKAAAEKAAAEKAAAEKAAAEKAAAEKDKGQNKAEQITDIERVSIEEYIKKIYNCDVGIILPNFTNINEADEDWLWLTSFHQCKNSDCVPKSELIASSKKLFGQNLGKVPGKYETGLDWHEQGEYYSIKPHGLLVDEEPHYITYGMTKNDSRYIVEIVEYVLDVTETYAYNGNNTIALMKGEKEIKRVAKEQYSEIQKYVKENTSMFATRILEIQETDGKLHIVSCRNK